MKVKIKSWAAMAAHYGLDEDGDILCDGIFSTHMEDWMPGDRIIEVDDSTEPFLWYVTTKDAYTISNDMIEFILPEEGDLTYGIAKPLGMHIK